MLDHLRCLLLLCLVSFTLACGREPAVEQAATGTGEAESRSLVVYSGRNKSLIGPLLERFSEQSGIKTEVRYGGTAELAATLLEEGDGSPCDVFLGQDAGALGALSAEGRFATLPASVLERVPPRYASPQRDWVGLSGRARSVVYNTAKVEPSDLPRSLEEVGDPRFRGRFGVAPANASFQAHMAVYRATHGADALDALLVAMVENQPGRYPKNSAIVEAVIQGEIDWGLVNHYYLWRALHENPEAPAANFLMPEGEVSTFINLAGAGMLGESAESRELMTFLVSDEAQRYFAEETYEYPLAEGVAAADGLLPLPELAADLDFSQVADALKPTLEAISKTGLLQ